MRSFLVGLAFLLLASAGAVAQVIGFVESVGYNGSFRPDSWTPMLVNLRSQVSEPMSYQLQVWQDDLDRDRVVYTKDITLSPSAQDKFQLYFIPRPSDNSLPVGNTAEFQRAVQVRICLPPKLGQRPEDARVVVDRLPALISVDNMDPGEYAGGMSRSSNKGKRSVIYVADSNEKFTKSSVALGDTQETIYNPVPASELGENVIYYGGVDAVLWLGANADDLDKGGAHRLEALEQFVRQGGHLVVCQPTERGKIAALARLLPIELKDASDNWLITMRDRPTLNDKLDVLPRMGAKRWDESPADLWGVAKGPFSIAIPKQLKSDAVADRVWPQYWDDKKTESTPFIVRHPYGLGAVTWVAQDLGNPNFQNFRRWPYIWERVFGWNDDDYVDGDFPLSSSPRVNRSRGGSGFQVPSSTTRTPADDYTTPMGSGAVDLGASLVKGMDFQAKGAAYVFVAILFFIGYWIAAGPGTYLFLSNKGKRELNWFVFGLWAFVATALTLGVVRVLLRGSPEIRHQTFVRMAPGEAAVVHSRIGLYIPRDGYQTIELKDTAKDAVSYITPFNVHPAYWTNTDYPAAQDYSVPIHDDPQPVRIEVPYRSTLKKLQAQWIGDIQGSVAGRPEIVSTSEGYIGQRVTNQTGVDLKNVYFVFNHLSSVDGDVSSRDWVLRVPEWKKDETLDLYNEFNNFASDIILTTNTPKKNQKGRIQDWAEHWAKAYGSGTMFGQGDTRGDDFDSHQDRKSFVIMSLIDRLPPDKNTEDHQRIEYLRRGGHDLNMSPAIAAGELVILAESKENDRPLPFPLLVEGDKVAGEGVILYQFVLPLDRSRMLKQLDDDKASASATKPTTQK
ncbi:MAG TPA: hypothetical protein VH370_23075 [Humisphaera sp.]|jgi:hypothetical protein|nr:hypothetical protein [Humisphaera sp.]